MILRRKEKRKVPKNGKLAPPQKIEGNKRNIHTGSDGCQISFS
jgi:hypothetical protein